MQGEFDQQEVGDVEEELVVLGVVWGWNDELVEDAFCGDFVLMGEGNGGSSLECALVPRSDKLRTSNLDTR